MAQTAPAGYPTTSGNASLPPAPPQTGHVKPQYPGQIAPQQPGVQYGYPPATVVVTQPGIAPMGPTQPAPASYMIASVIGCLFCLWPLGIGAIVASYNVQSAVARGDISSAQRSSNVAKIVNIVNFAIGFVIILTLVILYTSIASQSVYY
ncbi:proline-rich transmembrane protein 1-like [Ylistrum balloti]|uniref:proline-rich transmembrane protein 1-like n=1 Tax=Ylistrum balloti TaxID=509963 RepID=UPI002905D371|nr:proline-rich transmembrane protein 1-like [Ylistrum balloti]